MITDTISLCLLSAGGDSGTLLLKDEPGEIDVPALHRLDSIIDGLYFRISLSWAIRVSGGIPSYSCSEIIIRPCESCYPSAQELADLISHVERETNMSKECDE